MLPDGANVDWVFDQFSLAMSFALFNLLTLGSTWRSRDGGQPSLPLGAALPARCGGEGWADDQKNW